MGLLLGESCLAKDTFVAQLNFSSAVAGHYEL